MELEELLIGEIDLENKILDEQKAGDVNLKSKLGTCRIYVYNNECQIPHFHINSNNDDWECCIEIYKPLYFNHRTKQGKLNNKQSELLDKWMNKKSTLLSVSNWDMIDALWITSQNLQEIYHSIKENQIICY